MKITRRQLRQLLIETITEARTNQPYVVIVNAGQGRQSMWPKALEPGVYSKAEAEAIAKKQNKDSRSMGFGSIHYHAQPLSRDLLGGRYGVQPGNEAYIGLQKLLDKEALYDEQDFVDPDSIDSQDMADAKRYADDKTPEGMAKYLGISVDDWYTIRQELDDHYEDRHMEDQMAFDDDLEYPKILGYTHPETGESVMISVQSNDDMDDILDPLLRQYPDLAYSVD